MLSQKVVEAQDANDTVRDFLWITSGSSATSSRSGRAVRRLSDQICAEHRFARFDTLGRGYSAEELRAIIAGAKKAPQRKRPRSREQKQVRPGMPI